MSHASEVAPAKIDMQSSDLQAGTMPRDDTTPTDGLRPTRLFKAAGTRPEPALSVPSAKVTRSRATATADPELDPPGTTEGSNEFFGATPGVRRPIRPVAN